MLKNRSPQEIAQYLLEPASLSELLKGDILTVFDASTMEEGAGMWEIYCFLRNSVWEKEHPAVITRLDVLASSVANVSLLGFEFSEDFGDLCLLIVQGYLDHRSIERFDLLKPLKSGLQKAAHHALEDAQEYEKDAHHSGALENYIESSRLTCVYAIFQKFFNSNSSEESLSADRFCTYLERGDYLKFGDSDRLAKWMLSLSEDDRQRLFDAYEEMHVFVVENNCYFSEATGIQPCGDGVLGRNFEGFNILKDRFKDKEANFLNQIEELFEKFSIAVDVSCYKNAFNSANLDASANYQDREIILEYIRFVDEVGRFIGVDLSYDVGPPEDFPAP